MARAVPTPATRAHRKRVVIHVGVEVEFAEVAGVNLAVSVGIDAVIGVKG